MRNRLEAAPRHRGTASRDPDRGHFKKGRTMSLNQKYTWNDFLKEHPEHKEKRTKRTSSEGKKAFESAYKAFIKKYLSERSDKIAKQISVATKKRDEIVAKVKELRKAEKLPRAKFVQKKAGSADAAIARFEKQLEKTKTIQKNF